LPSDHSASPASRSKNTIGTSGIVATAWSKKTTDVSSMSALHRPARAPNSRVPITHVSTAAPIAARAPGTRADTSVTLPDRHETAAMAHG
jgi:hypothetical protein